MFSPTQLEAKQLEMSHQESGAKCINDLLELRAVWYPNGDDK